MGDKNPKKQKKQKKTDKKSGSEQVILTQPETAKKPKK